VEGQNLAGASVKEVILGVALARNLSIKPGDTVALLVNASGGSINALEAKVAGIFVSTNQAYDDSALRLPLVWHRHCCGKWSPCLVGAAKLIQSARMTIWRSPCRFPLSTNKLEFVPWYQQADFYNKTVALFSQQMNVLRLIIGASCAKHF